MRDPNTPNRSLPRRQFLRGSALCAASLAAPRSLATMASESAAALPGDTVWQLTFRNGQAVNCDLAFADLVMASPGKLCVLANSRGDNSTWHSCIVVPAGLLKSGQDYAITVSYEIIGRLDEDSYFYVFARSNRLAQLSLLEEKIE
jgi:hypothetical protein